jgi:hypothetical protein
MGRIYKSSSAADYDRDSSETALPPLSLPVARVRSRRPERHAACSRPRAGVWHRQHEHPGVDARDLIAGCRERADEDVVHTLKQNVTCCAYHKNGVVL